MNTDWKIINSYLQSADIEGLIEIGAPTDEYESEAKDIARGLAEISKQDWGQADIVAIISLIWARSFNLAADDMAKRLPAIQQVAEKIIAGL